MDLSILATLVKPFAPVIGGLLGGPVGAAALGALAAAFGTDATPEAVAEAVKADPDTARDVLADVEAKQGAALTELQARLADVKDARAQTIALAEAGSTIAWGAPVVSVLVMVGFCILSYLAINATQAANRDVVLFLLGAWQGLATVVVGYWVGSSASSKAKDTTIANMTADAAAAVIKAVKSKR